MGALDWNQSFCLITQHLITFFKARIVHACEIKCKKAQQIVHIVNTWNEIQFWIWSNKSGTKFLKKKTRSRSERNTKNEKKDNCREIFTQSYNGEWLLPTSVQCEMWTNRDRFEIVRYDSNEAFGKICSIYAFFGRFCSAQVLLFQCAAMIRSLFLNFILSFTHTLRFRILVRALQTVPKYLVHICSIYPAHSIDADEGIETYITAA